jgi:hypothetical protein
MQYRYSSSTNTQDSRSRLLKVTFSKCRCNPTRHSLHRLLAGRIPDEGVRMIGTVLERPLTCALVGGVVVCRFFRRFRVVSPLCKWHDSQVTVSVRSAANQPIHTMESVTWLASFAMVDVVVPVWGPPLKACISPAPRNNTEQPTCQRMTSCTAYALRWSHGNTSDHTRFSLMLPSVLYSAATWTALYIILSLHRT